MDAVSAKTAQQQIQQLIISTGFTERRLILLLEAIGWVYLAQHQHPPKEARALESEVKVWGYSLEDIPDAHLAMCFRRAFKHKTDEFMLKAAAVNREWEALSEELVALQTVNQDHPLMLSGPKKKYTRHADWKVRHKERYPMGCDLENCVECYRPLKGRGNNLFDEGPDWLHGAERPSAEEDAAMRQRIQERTQADAAAM